MSSIFNDIKEYPIYYTILVVTILFSFLALIVIAILIVKSVSYKMSKRELDKIVAKRNELEAERTKLKLKENELNTTAKTLQQERAALQEEREELDNIKEKFGFCKISRGNDININIERKNEFK